MVFPLCLGFGNLLPGSEGYPGPAFWYLTDVKGGPGGTGRTSRMFTGIIGRCDLNSKTGQEYLGFLESRRYLSRVQDDGKTLYIATEQAAEYIALFTRLYQQPFDTIPGFKL